MEETKPQTLADVAKFLVVDAEVRYVEDSKLNDVDDVAGNMPFMTKGIWKPVIDIAAGVIVGWPEGVTANIHYKVCDQGMYYLADQHKKIVAKYFGDYVPDEFLCHGSEGYGDYIIMDIDGTGKIKDYRVPEIDSEAWPRV